MYSRTGAAAYKKDITNTVKLCAFLGDPQARLKSVHIAGTNGKGSTSHMLASIFMMAGYKTGLYTSPHLKDFRERIKVDGEMIPEDNVTEFVERIRPVIREIEPSFFEITVGMAFDYFVKQQVDIAIIEVGLGGRLDSTNILTPELSIITNISWDHMDILGDSLEKIAIEKAGIIKSGVPVVVGEHNKATYYIFEKKAREEKAILTFADKKRYVGNWNFEHNLLVAEVTRSHTDEKTFYSLDLGGIYQVRNLLTVLEAVAALRQQGWDLAEPHVINGLRQVKKLTGLHGRWEIIHEHPLIILDVAHNEEGIKAVTDQLESTTYHHLLIVLGIVKDKEIDHVLNLLPKTATYFFTRAQIPRALPEDQLLNKARAAGLHGHHFPDVNTALKTAVSHADKDDLILVCGSVFVVGEVDKKSLPG